MATHIVTLSTEQSSRLDSLVAQGCFRSQQEAVEELLAQVLDDQAISGYSEDTLAHLRLGMAQANRGEFVVPKTLETFFDDWRRES